MKKKLFHLLAIASLEFFPFVSWAHPGHHVMPSLTEGFIHPFTGLDHLLAMLAVGVVASQRAKLWKGLLPLSFLGFLLLGGILGAHDLQASWPELGITLSIFILGLAVAFARFIHPVTLGALVGIFGLCHGYAHGIEMLPSLSLAQYAIGFTFATALLLSLGFILGIVGQRQWLWVTTLAGLSMCCSAFWF